MKRMFILQLFLCTILATSWLFIQYEQNNHTATVGTFGIQQKQASTLKSFTDKLYSELYNA